MKIVAINSSPTVCDDYGVRGDVTSLDKILSSIDGAAGRNDCIRAYVYALRDLQRAHDLFVHGDATDAEVDAAQATVAAAFRRLIVAEFSLWS